MVGRADGKVLFQAGLFLGVDGGFNVGQYRGTQPGNPDGAIGIL
jgi:hypothetical protein